MAVSKKQKKILEDFMNDTEWQLTSIFTYDYDVTSAKEFIQNIVTMAKHTLKLLDRGDK